MTKTYIAAITVSSALMFVVIAFLVVLVSYKPTYICTNYENMTVWIYAICNDFWVGPVFSWVFVCAEASGAALVCHAFAKVVDRCVNGPKSYAREAA